MVGDYSNLLKLDYLWTIGELVLNRSMVITQEGAVTAPLQHYQIRIYLLMDLRSNQIINIDIALYGIRMDRT